MNRFSETTPFNQKPKRTPIGRLGLTSMMLAELGIRIYKPAMIWPLEPTGLTAFATDVDELLIIEEKQSIVVCQN